ncbi:MAG: hypothetical protein RL557_559 [archaeon]|jgi:hypothetical protein
MKKGLVCSVVLLLLFISFSVAIEITLSKDSYQPQELLQAEIIGNFISLTADNVQIYTKEKVHAEPTIKDIIKYNNVYYFYAILPNQEGNYTLRIENAEYFERGVVKKETIESNLTIIYKNTSDLSINPGFVIPAQDFSVKVKSLYKNPMVKAVFDATGETKEFSLLESEERTVTFALPPLPPGKSKLTINDYEIPVFLLKKGSVSQQSQLEFIPYEIKDNFNQNYAIQIVIKNTGTTNLSNIAFATTLPTTFSPNTIDFLEANGIKIINVTFQIANLNQSVSGNIEATAANQTFFLPVVLTYNKTITFSNGSSPSLVTRPVAFTCSQIGNLCTENQLCNGESVESLDGPCCIGDCIEEENSSYSSIIGIVLVIVLIIIVFYAGYRIMKRRKLKNADEVLEEKANRFERRLKGEEVRGKLDRI